MARKATRTWLGGYVRLDARGKATFYIRRMVGGREYDLSTRCRTERAALAELEAFEKNPGGYVPGGAAPLLLTRDLVEPFLKWSRDVEKNSPDWVKKKRTYLADWADDLRGKDLRRLSLGAHIVPAIDNRATARHHRIAILKAFFSWLCAERHVMETRDNPTLGLAVPQSRPEQWTKKKTIDLRGFVAVRDRLQEPWRSMLVVLAGTGWHVTELYRFAKGGEVEERRGLGGVAGVLSVTHKSGDPHRTQVSSDVLEAARAVRAHGAFSRRWLYAAIQRACAEAKVKPFAPGMFRHTVATFAVDNGASLDAASSFLGHKSGRTTRRFYATHATPAKVPTPV